jgi:hypothetical protein
MGTLGGFPCPPALWLWRAKPAFAYAIMGTPERGRSALRPLTAAEPVAGTGNLNQSLISEKRY